MLRELYEAIIRAFIRWWEGKFNYDNHIDWIKLEVEKERLEKRKLLDYILEQNKSDEKEVDLSGYKPLNQRVPWAAKRAQLEKDDRELHQLKNQPATRSIDELEQELLDDKFTIRTAE